MACTLERPDFRNDVKQTRFLLLFFVFFTVPVLLVLSFLSSHFVLGFVCFFLHSPQPYGQQILEGHTCLQKTEIEKSQRKRGRI